MDFGSGFDMIVGSGFAMIVGSGFAMIVIVDWGGLGGYLPK